MFLWNYELANPEAMRDKLHSNSNRQGGGRARHVRNQHDGAHVQGEPERLRGGRAGHVAVGFPQRAHCVVLGRTARQAAELRGGLLLVRPDLGAGAIRLLHLSQERGLA